MGRYFFLLTIVVVTAWVAPTLAQSEKSFSKVRSDQLQSVMNDKTFFRRRNLDRLYFSSNGDLIQQINSGWEDVTPGDILKASWFVDSDQLCWRYDTETSESYNIEADKEFCYSVFADKVGSPDFMKLHNDEIFLYNVENGESSGKPEFHWNQWSEGNYIFDPDYVPSAQEALYLMSEYRDNKDIGSIIRADLNDNMKGYYDLMVGKIFYARDHYLYMHKSGGYFYTNKSMIEGANGNWDSLISSDNMSSWFIKDDIHCYGAGNRTIGGCEWIAPKGEGLIRDYQGYFGVHMSGYGRIYNAGMPIGHMDPKDSIAPELFARVDAIFENQVAEVLEANE